MMSKTIHIITMVTVFVSILLTSFNVVGSLFILYIKDIYQLEFVTPIAIALTISGGISIIAIVFAGYLYDKYGLEAPISIAIASMILWALLMNFMSRVRSWDDAKLLWYAGGLLQGLTLASIMISVNTTLMTLFPYRRGLAVSVSQSAQASAMAFWSYIVTYLIQMLGFFNALTVMGLAGSISIILMTVMFKYIRKDVGKDVGGNVSATSSVVSGVRDTKIKLVVIYMMILFIATSSIAIMSFLAGIIEEPFIIAIEGVDSVSYVRTVIVPKIMTITGVLQAISAMLWGYAIDKVGVLRTIPVIYGLQTVLTLVAYITYRANPWIVAVSIMLRYMFFVAEPLAHWVLIPTVFGTRNLGKILGVVNSAPMLALLIAPTLAGLIRDAIGSYSYILLTSSILSTISLTIYLYLKKALDKAKTLHFNP